MSECKPSLVLDVVFKGGNHGTYHGAGRSRKMASA